uniref:Spaetzle domain-containing protein n=1 Tax=Anopheles maculatus TaxID=74869 RepID=A0A182SNP8_9DIPT
MRLTLVVCGFLLGLVLAPIDGRLKYAEVFPNEALQNLLLAETGSSLEGSDRDDQDTLPFTVDERPTRTKQFPSSVHDATSTTRHKTDCKEKPTPNNAQADAADASVKLLPLNCFPPADRLHKYDWARYHLRHMAAGSSRSAPTESVEAGGKVDDFSRSEFVARKRSDFNREISTDLYTQYPSSCACQTKYELRDLGYTHFPRYVVNAICQNRSANSRKCWRGSSCKEIPYKVRVLTKRSDNESGEHDHHSTLLPEPLREYWRFKTVTIAAACQCSI